MALKNIKIVSKFLNKNVVDIGAVYGDGHTRLLARIFMPEDNQLADSIDTCKEIENALSKRIRKSLM